jgi:hypothetical protein
VKKNRTGTSLIDLVISMAIVAVLFGGVYLVYFSIITAVANISVRGGATTAIGNEIEMIRNLPYDSVGTVGGVPSGIIPQSQTVTVGNYIFTLNTTIRNIDDPFDGTLGGNPNDTAPADYKLVSITETCPLCDNNVSMTITTTVAPKNLESTTVNGSLFIYALNANGVGVPEATVKVIDASVTPSINLIDTTNASGVLELVGVPTSTQGYSISVTKPGYSADRTYPPGAAGNPNPVKPNATVVAQTVTALSFSIDQLSSLALSVTDDRCNAIPNESFSVQGTKLIGTPNVLKFSTSSAMGASGTSLMQNLEWDTYTLTVNDASHDLMGTIPLDPIVLNPSSTESMQFILAPSANPALLATVTNAATGAGITGANVTVSKSGFSKTQTTGQATVSQTDWSGGQFSSQSGGMNANVPGILQLLANASSTYPTSTVAWLISNTIDLGGSSSTLYVMSWTPTTEPTSTGVGSISFQVAADNNNATWNFIGPDGTASSYFTSTSSSLPASLSGNRYVRYEVFMRTQDPNTSPALTSVTFAFSANCVPPAQTLFTGLPQGSYSVNVSALNYNNNSTTVSVGAGFQSSTIPLIHQ